MTSTDTKSSIFRDVDGKIDQILKLSKGLPPKFRHRAASDELSARGRMTIGAELIREMYSQIEKNWTSGL